MKIKGVVIGGNRVGSKLGFPTANIAVESGLKIEDGVYAAKAYIEGNVYGGMVNLGYRPTIEHINGKEETQRLLEINIFEFDDNLYGKVIEVELVKFMRPEETFDTLEELKKAVENDKIEIGNYLKSI